MRLSFLAKNQMTRNEKQLGEHSVLQQERREWFLTVTAGLLRSVKD